MHSFATDDMVYVKNPSTQKRRLEEQTSKEASSLKLRPKKSGTYRVVRSAPHTVTIDISGLHNVVTVERVTLAQAAREEGQEVTGQGQDEESAAKDGDTPNAE